MEGCLFRRMPVLPWWMINRLEKLRNLLLFLFVWIMDQIWCLRKHRLFCRGPTSNMFNVSLTFLSPPHFSLIFPWCFIGFPYHTWTQRKKISCSRSLKKPMYSAHLRRMWPVHKYIVTWTVYTLFLFSRLWRPICSWHLTLYIIFGISFYRLNTEYVSRSIESVQLADFV